MSDEHAEAAAEAHVPPAAYPAIIETLASLVRRMELIEAEQREQARSIDRATLHVGELAERLQTLQGTVLRLDRWIEMLIQDVDGARTIVIQAEHQMQQGVAAISERLIDLTADVHQLHLIRESPEYKINTLKAELVSVHERLVAVETAQPAQAE